MSLRNPFIHDTEKRSNILWKSCAVNTARFLKYVWPFFNIKRERVKVLTFKPLSANPTKWSNTLGNSRQIVSVRLTILWGWRLVNIISTNETRMITKKKKPSTDKLFRKLSKLSKCFERLICRLYYAYDELFHKWLKNLKVFWGFQGGWDGGWGVGERGGDRKRSVALNGLIFLL